MKTRHFSLPVAVLLLCFAVQLEAQITIEKKGFRTTYSENGQVLKAKELKSILSNDPSSSPVLRKSATFSYISSGAWLTAVVFEGAALYYTLKENEALNEQDWDNQKKYETKSFQCMFIGIGCMLVAVPVGLVSHSYFKKSINLYNSAHNSGSTRSIDMRIGYTGNGFGLQVRF